MLEITSLSQFNSLLKSTPLVIIDFYATWCGPCKAISPRFAQLATASTSPSVVFAKCDVDKAQAVAQACNITAMPTFQFFKGGKKADEVRGADVAQLNTKIGFYTAAAAKEDASGAKKEPEKKAAASTQPGSLRAVIDVDKARLLNASLLSSARNVASPPPAGYAVASAGGPKVLLYLPFTQAVNASTIRIVVPKDAMGSAPSRVLVAADVPVRTMKTKEGTETNDLSMEGMAKVDNTQAFNVYSDEYVNGTAELRLKASKFSGVKSLTIRVDANLSGEATAASKIGEMDIIGTKA